MPLPPSRTWPCVRIWLQVGENIDWFDRLTPKEREVLETYARKHSYKAVAQTLGKSPNVVDQQLASVRRKMGVSSIAEAMYMLAERNARLSVDPGEPSARQSADQDSAAVPRTRDSGARWSSRLTTLSIVAGACIGIALASFAHRTSAIATTRILSADELTNRIIGRRGEVGEQIEANRARLVGELSDLAWQAMWGPDEDHVLGCLSEVEPEVRAGFEWSVQNDPDLAVRIVGNGHRLFSRLDGLSKWPDMLDRAISNPRATRGLEYGRALCGSAFAHWDDAPKHGFERAEEALKIFKQLPGSDWEEANALRHMGLCSAKNITGRLALYDRARQIFERLGDDRGRAHVMLGIAQSGYDGRLGEKRPVPVVATQTDWALKAADAFRSLKNENMLNEALGEVDRSGASHPFPCGLRQASPTN